MSDSHSPSPTPSQPIVIRENIDSLSASLSDQIEMLAGELRTRWKSGKRIGVEQLGSAFEQLAKNEEQLLDLIYHEVLIREEFGEKPKLEDFTARFPQHVDRLQRLFAVHGAIEDDGWDEELDSAFADQARTMTGEDGQERPAPSSTDLGDSGERKKSHWPRKSRDSRPVEPPPGYELLEEIGRGGMAVVFRAKQQILNRVVALKMLLAGGVASKEVLARVQQEARAVAQLQHPGIVQIHEVGEHRGLPFLSLEYVAGGTLHEWLNGRPLPPLEAARIIEQLARTTQYAHERGVVHRDLKPANVLLTERPVSMQSSTTIPVGEITPPSIATLARAGDSDPSNPRSGERGYEPQTKISDFGLARVLGSRSDLTATGQVIGTPSYMAPEQAAGTVDDVSPAQDIYSLGAILYELLTGRPPFRGSSLFDTLEQVRTTEAVPPRQLQPRVPRDIETICLKCLEKLPDRRYPTAAALADDLRRVQDGDTITARPAGSFERGWKWVRRYPAVSSLSLLTVLLTVVGAVGILREAQRANQNEASAIIDSQRADHQRRFAETQQIKAEEQAKIALQERLNAEEQRTLAEEAQRNAEQQRQVAEAERTRAVQAQAQAEASFDRTMTTIKSLADLGTSLRSQPGQQATSKRLLDETLRLYDELAKEQGTNSTLRRRRISALVSAGEIRKSLREYDESEKLLKQSAELVESEIQLSPSDPDLNYRATTVYWNLAILYKDSDRPNESLESLRRYAVAIDAVLEKYPGNSGILTSKANALTNECIILIHLGRPLDALVRYDEAITILRDVLKRLPDHLGAQNELALVLHDYSTLLRRLGRVEPAEAAFREAFALRKALFQKFPKDVFHRSFLARLHTSQGEIERAAKHYDEAIAQHQQAVTLTQSLADDFPDIYEYQRITIGAMIEQLNVCLAANNTEIGKPLQQRLAARLQIAFQKFPKDQYVVDKVADWLDHCAAQLWEDGQKAQATSLAKSALQAAVAALTLTTALKPDEEARLLNGAAWKLTVIADPSLRDHKKSVSLARRAVELVPEHPYYAHTLGTALYYAGEFAAAREHLLRAIQLEQATEKRGTLDQLALAFKALPKDAAAARKELDVAFGLKKRPPEVMSIYYSMLAMTLWQLDEKEAARSVLRLVVDPPNDFSKDGPELRRMIAEARALVGAE